MNRRSILLGLGAALAAPAIIRTPGLLMPVRRLSAAEIDPADINGIIAELPDGARWVADPDITYWAEGPVTVHAKRDIWLYFIGASVEVRTDRYLLSIKDADRCGIVGGIFTDPDRTPLFSLSNSYPVTVTWPYSAPAPPA